MNYSDFFIAIYTNECKKYCDKKFFVNLFESNIKNSVVCIVDNSINEEYANYLKPFVPEIYHIDVSREDKSTLFLRNVTESVNFLRDKFLETDCKYFVTLESDVCPPKNWLDYFLEVIDKGDIIGGIYYPGFHSQELFDNDDIIQEFPCILSGCTLYKREVIEKFPFRWDSNNVNAFPDAWMSQDAGNYGYRLINYSKITCQHLTKENSDSRGIEDLK